VLSAHWMARVDLAGLMVLCCEVGRDVDCGEVGLGDEADRTRLLDCVGTGGSGWQWR